MSVSDLDSEYALDLPWGKSLGWLATGLYPPRTLDALTDLARIDLSRLRTLETPADWADATRAAYCPRCVFLNPVDVTQPFWKREWLDPAVTTCGLHQRRLLTIAARTVRSAANMTRLIKAVGNYERFRRFRASLAPHSHDPWSYSHDP
jgi:hypothetical protein